MSSTKTQFNAVAPKSPANEKPHRRVRMCDALRAEGVNESVIAQTYRDLLERTSAEGSTQYAKLLLETARDCVEILDPADQSDEIPANAIVQLIHNVPRPERDAASEGNDGGSAMGEEDGDFKFQN